VSPINGLKRVVARELYNPSSLTGRRSVMALTVISVLVIDRRALPSLTVGLLTLH